MQAAKPMLVAVAALCAGAGCASFRRPDGGGGWSTERRQAELADAARHAQVPIDAPAMPAPPRGPLTLDDALAMAARENRPMAIASARVDGAAAAVRDAQGRLLPNVSGSGRYAWYTDPQTNSFSVPVGTRTLDNTIAIRDAEFGTLNGTATVPVDLWGELRHALAAAQAGYRGERARAWATTLEQHLQVIRAYFGLLQTQRLRAVTDESIAFRRQQLANARQKFDAGRLTKNEVLVVEVALADVEQLGRRQSLALDQARWQLNDAIGLPVDAPTSIADVGTHPDLPTTEAALQSAWSNNPALVVLLEERQRAIESETALVRSRLPRVAGGAAVDWTTSDILEPQRSGSAFVGFTWDLGLDGRREAQITQARVAIQQNRLALEQELRGLEGAIRQTQGAVAERLAAIATAEAAVAQADENVRIRQQQFDAGRATSEDVLAAEALLSTQRAALATARYEAHVRRAELQRLMGLPFDPTPAR